MAYSEEQYRIENARKTNERKFPNGYLYILSIPKYDLYKIGVSQNPKRRIRDIKSVLPFNSEVIYLKYFKKVYELEKIVHDRFVSNKVKSEWFQVYEDDIKELKGILNEIHESENK